MTTLHTINTIDDSRQLVQQLSYGSMFMLLDNFIVKSLQEIPIWTLVMVTFVVADLISAKRQHWLSKDKQKEEWRWSGSIRKSLAKIATYLSALIAFILLNEAWHSSVELHKIILIVIFIAEGMSIIGHIVAPLGYKVDYLKVVHLALSKTFKVTKEDLQGVLVEKSKPNKK